MEHSSVSVEDFQDYHNRSPAGDTEGVFHSSAVASKEPPQHDSADESASLSGSAHGHSTSAEDEAVFDPPMSQTSSPRTSHDSSDEEISVLQSAYSSSRHASGIPFTPSKAQSPFHRPSSVRAMQLDTTPPHLTTPSSQRKRFHTPSRQTSTPRSARSGHRSTPSKLMNSSPVKTVKKEHPLVLLHVTILPLAHHYSLEVLETVLPPTIFVNWKLLLERTNPTVLHRGVLIPHPREDYDMLEERLLESLELKQPRILKCGHFHLSPEEEADIEASEDEDRDDMADADICDDCGRRVRDGRFGDAGSGSKRWDVKVFAANGLMRAGAWSAAWREMERVDVEILPWMEESMKRELQLRSEEEERTKKEDFIARKEDGVAGLDDERLREIYGQDASFHATLAKGRAQDDIDGLVDQHAAHEIPRSPSQSPFRFQNARGQRHDIPLWDLLRNYLYLMAQDPRNIAIWVLSGVLLFLAIRSSPSTPVLSASGPLEAPSQVVSAATSAATPSITERVVDAVADGGSSILSSAAAMATTFAGATSSLPSADPRPTQTENINAQSDIQDEGSVRNEAAGEVMSGILEG